MIVIIDYKAGNTRSVQFALQRLGVEASLTAEVEQIRAADKVIFPGVGQAASAMKNLKKAGLERLIPRLKQPVLGVCLGMQLMCTHTEEGDVEGLGIFDVEVKHFSKEQGLKVPHMGWNTVRMERCSLWQGLDEEDYFYFVHSYFVARCADTIGICDYGEPFSAALQKNNFYATQFHPEKSGKAGAKVLENFLQL